MRILVTGATGFVGARLVRAGLERGHEMHVLIRATSDTTNLDGLDVCRHTGDVTRPQTLSAAVAGCEAVLHAAADYALWVPDPDAMYAVNVEGTKAVLAAAREHGVRRIVHTSSVATKAAFEDGTIADEDTPVTLADMIGHYKRSKFLAERAVVEATAEGIDAVVVNPSAPVGPGDIRPTPTGQMVLDAARGRMPFYVEGGLNIVHVDDVAAGHFLALERGRRGEAYILGGENMTLEKIFTVIARHAGVTPPRTKVPHGLLAPVAWASEAAATITRRAPRVTVDGLRLARKKMFFSHAKAERELGYRARPADEALRDAVAWFEASGRIGTTA